MTTQIHIGDPPIAVGLRTSARAKRLSLRVSRLDGTVNLTVPSRAKDREVRDFLSDREAWIRKHLATVSPLQVPTFDQSFPYLGRDVTLRAADVRRPMLDEDDLILPTGEDRLAARLVAFLKTRAREELAAACDRHSGILCKPYGKLTLRDTRSRWGSCTSAGDLMFSWRLIMAPPEVLDYVAAHEVAHLREMNHSAAFWDLCSQLYPQTKQARGWLKSNGSALHRWQFT